MLDRVLSPSQLPLPERKGLGGRSSEEPAGLKHLEPRGDGTSVRLMLPRQRDLLCGQGQSPQVTSHPSRAFSPGVRTGTPTAPEELLVSDHSRCLCALH